MFTISRQRGLATTSASESSQPAFDPESAEVVGFVSSAPEFR